MSVDYLIVGCGLFGSVFGRCVAERGHRVLIVDQRDHIGGNCYSQQLDGIHVHRYGPHIFHTNDETVWRFVNRFTAFNDYCYRGAVSCDGRLLSFPINLITFQQLWGVTTPEEARRKLDAVRRPIEAPSNLEDWILSQVGDELYEIFIRGYTRKQWGRDPRELPASIVRRLPIRLTADDRYFSDRYQGIPIGGYTRMFENILDHENIRVETGVNYFEHRREFDADAGRLVYSGQIDRFFDYRCGRLEYRSLRFRSERHSGDFQGAAVVNYTSETVPHTRIIEHRHFERRDTLHTWITYEYPEQFDESKVPYYPIRDDHNAALCDRYGSLARQSGVLFGGRLGTYRYYDMHQVIAQALTMAQAATTTTRVA